MMLQLRMEYELDSLLGNSFDLSVILYFIIINCPLSTAL